MCLAISLPVHGKGPLPSCAHHMGHFIYIAGSTHLYLVRLRGHPRLELKKRVEEKCMKFKETGDE